MNNPVTERLAALRDEMGARGIDLYVIPISDFHESEYIGEYFKAVKYLSGFTGSNATLVVLQKEAYLWTDGRYFIQAGKQLAGSGISLQKMGEEGVPTVEELVKERLPEGGCIGFDGRVVGAEKGISYQKIAAEKHGALSVEEDLAGIVWEGRPDLPKEPFFVLEETYSGRSVASKLSDVRDKMKEEGADVHLLASLCDIAWLLNIRGNDIPHVPVVLSYLAVTEEECVWFVQEGVVTAAQKRYFDENRIDIKPYEEIYRYAACLHGRKVLLDEGAVNFRIVSSLPDDAKKVVAKNPTELLKAVKNPTEIANTIQAHIKDGVAITKFMYWLKTTVGKEQITELSAEEYLKERRMEQEHFLDLSFNTICAYGANAAMMHYEATPESYAALEPKGFLLVDSGGHYLEGTTDITRTMALGPLTDEMRRYFTATLRANLNLASAKFLHGCTGYNLDILARGPLWDFGMDYKCGTGHGVGYLLNVHEGPNTFRWKRREQGRVSGVLEEGMITTNEPGVYIEGAYGIRIENELVCRKAEKNEYGQFLVFEDITYAPIDLDAIDADALSSREKTLLNAYHKKVYETLSVHLTDEENRWLQEYTREI